MDEPVLCYLVWYPFASVLTYLPGYSVLSLDGFLSTAGVAVLTTMSLAWMAMVLARARHRSLMSAPQYLHKVVTQRVLRARPTEKRIVPDADVEDGGRSTPSGSALAPSARVPPSTVELLGKEAVRSHKL